VSVLIDRRAVLIEAPAPTFVLTRAPTVAPVVPGRADGPLSATGDGHLGDGSTQLAAALQRRYPGLKIKALYNADGDLEHACAYDPKTGLAHDARGTFPSTATAFDGFGATGERGTTRDESAPAPADGDDACDAYVTRHWAPFETGGALDGLTPDADADSVELDALLGGDRRQPTYRALPSARLEEAIWNDKLHPRWPAGTPHKGGQFMKVGERFHKDGHEWEITQVAGNKIIAAEASGVVDKAETRVFDTKNVGPTPEDKNVLVGATPAAPRALKSGFIPDYTNAQKAHIAKLQKEGKEAELHTYLHKIESGLSYIKTAKPDENSVVIDADRHQETHDPSIKPHPLSKLTPAQWERFGKVDQLYYNEVMDRFGAWQTASGGKPPPISSQSSQWAGRLQEIQAGAPSDAVSMLAAEVGDLKGATHGDQMSGVKVFDGLLKDQALLTKAQAKYQRFREHESDVNSLIAWDLYNRLAAPDMTVIHKAAGAEVFKKAIQGKASVLSGLSTSWKTGSWSEPHSFVFAMPVRQVAFFETLMGQGWGSGSGESELANLDRLKVGAGAGYYQNHEMGHGASGQAAKLWKWLTGQLNKDGQGGGLAANLKKHFADDDPFTLDLGTVDLNFQLKKAAGAKTYWIPPDDVMQHIEEAVTANPGHEAWEEQKSIADMPEDMKPKPGMIVTKGGQQAGTRYLVIQSDAVGKNEIQYIPLLTGSNDYDVNPTGGGYKSTKCKVILGDDGKPLFFPLPPPPQERTWSHDLSSLAPAGPAIPVGTMNIGDKIAVNGDHWKITKKTSSLVTIQSLSDGSEGTVDSLGKTKKLEPTGVGHVGGTAKYEPKAGADAIFGNQVVHLTEVGGPGDETVKGVKPDGSTFTTAKSGITQLEPLPKLTPQKGDTFPYDGTKMTVTNVMKDGTVKAKGPADSNWPHVIAFGHEGSGPAAPTVTDLFRPGDYQPGAKQKLHSYTPGALVSGSGAKVHPYQVLGTQGTKTWLKNLDTGEVSAVSKNVSYASLGPKIEVPPGPEPHVGPVPHEQWKMGDKVATEDLQIGDKINTGGGADWIVAGESTHQGEVGWQLEGATDPSVDAWIPKNLSGKSGKDDLITYLGKGEAVKPVPVSVKPSELTDVVEHGGLAAFAWPKSGTKQHPKLSTFPEGAHVYDKKKQLWKVQQPGEHPILTDGQNLYKADGNLYVNTAEPGTFKPLEDTPTVSAPLGSQHVPNYAAGLKLGQLDLKTGDEFTMPNGTYKMMPGGQALSPDGNIVTPGPNWTPDTYMKAKPPSGAPSAVLPPNIGDKSLAELNPKPGDQFTTHGHTWTIDTVTSAQNVSAHANDAAITKAFHSFVVPTHYEHAPEPEPQPAPSVIGRPPAGFEPILDMQGNPAKFKADQMQANDMALSKEGLVYLHHDTVDGDQWKKIGGEKVDIAPTDEVVPLGIEKGFPNPDQISMTTDYQDIHDIPTGQTFFTSGDPWVVLGHGDAGTEAMNLKTGVILPAPAAQSGKFALGDYKHGEPAGPEPIGPDSALNTMLADYEAGQPGVYGSWSVKKTTENGTALYFHDTPIAWKASNGEHYVTTEPPSETPQGIATPAAMQVVGHLQNEHPSAHPVPESVLGAIPLAPGQPGEHPVASVHTSPTVAQPGIALATSLKKGHQFKIKLDGTGAEYEALEDAKPGMKSIQAKHLKSGKVYPWKVYSDDKQVLITKAPEPAAVAPPPDIPDFHGNAQDKSIGELGLGVGDFFKDGGVTHQITGESENTVTTKDPINGITYGGTSKEFVPSFIPVKDEPAPSPSAPIPDKQWATLGELNVGDKYTFQGIDPGYGNEVIAKDANNITIKDEHTGQEETLPLSTPWTTQPILTYKAPAPAGGNAAGQLGAPPHISEMPIQPYLWPKSGSKKFDELSTLQPGEQFTDKNGVKGTVYKHNVKQLGDPTATTTVQMPDGGMIDIPQQFVNEKGKVLPTRISKLSTTVPVPEPATLTSVHQGNDAVQALVQGDVASFGDWHTELAGPEGHKFTMVLYHKQMPVAYSDPDGQVHITPSKFIPEIDDVIQTLKAAEPNYVSPDANTFFEKNLADLSGPKSVTWKTARVGDIVKTIGGDVPFKITGQSATNWEITSQTDGSMTHIPKDSTLAIELVGHESVAGLPQAVAPGHQEAMEIADKWMKGQGMTPDQVTEVHNNVAAFIAEHPEQQIGQAYATSILDKTMTGPTVSSPYGYNGLVDNINKAQDAAKVGEPQVTPYMGDPAPLNPKMVANTAGLQLNQLPVGTVFSTPSMGDESTGVYFTHKITANEDGKVIGDDGGPLVADAIPSHVWVPPDAGQKDGNGEKLAPGDAVAWNGAEGYTYSGQHPDDGTVAIIKDAQGDDLYVSPEELSTLGPQPPAAPPTAEVEDIPYADDASPHGQAINAADDWLLKVVPTAKTANWIHVRAAEQKATWPGWTWGEAYASATGEALPDLSTEQKQDLANFIDKNLIPEPKTPQGTMVKAKDLHQGDKIIPPENYGETFVVNGPSDDGQHWSITNEDGWMSSTIPMNDTYVEHVGYASAPPETKAAPEMLPHAAGPATTIPNYTSATNGGLDLTITGGAGGTTGAQNATGPNGSKWLIKGYGGNQDRVATEVLANAVYRTMGLNAAEAGIINTPDGQTKLAYEKVGGDIKHWSGTDEAKMKALGQGIMTDALVGNWDFAGLEDDNVLWNGDDPTRIDQGGTFMYRAQGKPKPFGPEPVEVKSLLSGQGQGVNGVSVSAQEMRQQAAQIAQTMTPEKIDQLVDAAPFKDQQMKEQIRNNLKARVDWMYEFADGAHADMLQGVKLAPDPSPPPTPKPEVKELLDATDWTDEHKDAYHAAQGWLADQGLPWNTSVAIHKDAMGYHDDPAGGAYGDWPMAYTWAAGDNAAVQLDNQHAQIAGPIEQALGITKAQPEPYTGVHSIEWQKAANAADLYLKDHGVSASTIGDIHSSAASYHDSGESWTNAYELAANDHIPPGDTGTPIVQGIRDPVDQSLGITKVPADTPSYAAKYEVGHTVSYATNEGTKTGTITKDVSMSATQHAYEMDNGDKVDEYSIGGKVAAPSTPPVAPSSPPAVEDMPITPYLWPKGGKTKFASLGSIGPGGQFTDKSGTKYIVVSNTGGVTVAQPIINGQPGAAITIPQSMTKKGKVQPAYVNQVS